MRLQNKILLLLIPLIVLPILALGWSSYTQTMEDSHTQSRQQMTSLLEQIQFHTESQLRTARANASLFARSELVERFTNGGISTELKVELTPVILDMLFNYQQAYPEYYEIRIVSPEGKEELRSALGDVG
ncbi:MAG: hypothetical protein OEU51_09240, partial [Gammaproteobacteria bacterium]|nr:hypothetical protein [Gammaproteobacteria bacterium]